jgi:hypothetical protein
MIDKKKVRSLLQITGSIIGLILIMFQIKNGISGFNDNQVGFLNVRYLFLSLLFATIALFFQILGWNKIFSFIGIILPLRKVLFGYTFTFLPRYIPGTIWGYLTRSEWLLRIYDIPYKNSLFVSFMEMIIIFITNVVLGSFIFYYSTKNLLLLIIPIILPFFTFFLIKYLSIQPLGKKYFTNDYLRLNFSSWSTIFFIFIISWILYGIGLFFSISSFSLVVEIDLNFVLLVTSINSFSWIIGFIVFFIPAGIGIRETILNYLLINLLFLPVNLSSSIAITNRIITLFAELILLICSYFLKPINPNLNGFLKINN